MLIILLFFPQLLLTVGILYSYILGATASYLLTGILCGLIPVIFLVIFFFMPETPVYLLKKDKRQEAEKVLQWLRGRNYDVKIEKAAIQVSTVIKSIMSHAFLVNAKNFLRSLFIHLSK